MQQNRTATYGVAVTAALTLSLLGWTHFAHAQDDAAKPATDPAQAGQQAPPGGPGGRMRMMGGPPSLAASGDYVFVLRGNTLYQMKASDLSLVTQKDLPAPAAPGANP